MSYGTIEPPSWLLMAASCSFGMGTATSSVTEMPNHDSTVESTMTPRMRYRNMMTGWGTLFPAFSMPSSIFSERDRFEVVRAAASLDMCGLPELRR